MAMSASTLLSLIQAGYPVVIVLRVCVHSINGVQSRSGSAAMECTADPEFYELIHAWCRIQQSGDLGVRIIREEKDKKEAAALNLLAPYFFSLPQQSASHCEGVAD